VLGGLVSVAATGVNTHTITPSDASQLPFLSIEEAIGAGLEVYNYNDVVANTFHLEADANGYLLGTSDLIGRQQVAGATPTPSGTILWDNSPMTVGTNITVTYNGVTVPARTFKIDITNNFETTDHRLGSLFLGDLTPKRRDITAGFHIREKDSALWRQATYGLPSATVPGGLATKQQLIINASTYETIAGGTPLTPYSLQFTIPKFILRPFALAPNADDVIESDIEGQAVRPDPASPIMTVVVKNAKAAAV
jgi:hypothetical protein